MEEPFAVHARACREAPASQYSYVILHHRLKISISRFVDNQLWCMLVCWQFLVIVFRTSNTVVYASVHTVHTLYIQYKHTYCEYVCVCLFGS